MNRPWHQRGSHVGAQRGAHRAARLCAGFVAVVFLTLGLIDGTGASFTNDATVTFATKAIRDVCVIDNTSGGSVPTFALATPTTLNFGATTWTAKYVDATSATVESLQTRGCDVVAVLDELKGSTGAAWAVAQAWWAAGGRVLTTGNDASTAQVPFISPTTDAVGCALPTGGAVPAAAAVRSAVTPTFPSWSASSTWSFDGCGQGMAIGSVAGGATCVGLMPGHPTWCAVVAATGPLGGRWVHMATLIGSPASPADSGAASSALGWLSEPRTA